LRSCAKLRELIKMSFGVVTGIGRGMCMLDEGPHPQGQGDVLGVFSLLVWTAFMNVFLKQKCIRLVREKLTIFLNGLYNNGIAIYSSNLRYTCYKIEVGI